MSASRSFPSAARTVPDSWRAQALGPPEGLRLLILLTAGIAGIGTADIQSPPAYKHGMLRKLSREKREAFALFEIEGLTHQEIAELTGAKVETVRTRVHYARKEFERLAAELGVSP